MAGEVCPPIDTGELRASRWDAFLLRRWQVFLQCPDLAFSGKDLFNLIYPCEGRRCLVVVATQPQSSDMTAEW